MFGRVSNVNLGQYANIPELVEYAGGFGVFAGKKWTGSYGPYSELVDLTPQVEAGWIEFADDSYSYPEYSFEGLGLPDWVNCKRTEGTFLLESTAPRFLIGDGTNSIGPFTLQEAVYFYSVTKKLKPNQIDIDLITADAAGTVATVTTNESSFDPNNSGETGATEPYYLFRPARKNYTELYAQGSNDNGSGDPELSAYAFAQGQVYAETFKKHDEIYSNLYNTAVVVIDIDEPKDYYICDVGYVISGTAQANASADKYDEDNNFTGSSYSFSYSFYKLAPYRFSHIVYSYNEETGQDEVQQILNQVGDTYTFGTYTLTYVSATMNYKVGEITKPHTLYGIQAVDNNSGSSGDDPPAIPSTSASAPLPTSFEVSASEYWPYKTVDGQPVYNETTGAIINPPIP